MGLLAKQVNLMGRGFGMSADEIWGVAMQRLRVRDPQQLISSLAERRVDLPEKAVEGYDPDLLIGALFADLELEQAADDRGEGVASPRRPPSRWDMRDTFQGRDGRRFPRLRDALQRLGDRLDEGGERIDEAVEELGPDGR